jgi:uncharacterized protein YutE (UPF0331/DUF86 family)
MDKEIIIKRLKYIQEKLEDISYNITKHSQAEDVNERKTYQAALERWSEEVVESAVNINNELLESINEFSFSYFESFSKLKILNIFDDKTLKKLSSTSGFRNRLAHEYMELDPKITIESIKQILNLYKIYIKKIEEYITKTP